MYWKRNWVSSADTSCLVVAHPHQFGGSGMRRDGGGAGWHNTLAYQIPKGKHFNSFTFI